jgi:transketolase
VGALRTLPGLTIVIPADGPQTASAFAATHRLPGPVYYSLGKDDATVIPGLNGAFELAQPQIIRRGADLAILAMGSVAAEAVAAAEELGTNGIESTVAVVSSFNPDPGLTDLLARFRVIITVEAQTISGGLASCIALQMARQGLGGQLCPLAIEAPQDGTTGSPADRLRKHGLDRTAIAATAYAALIPLSEATLRA